MMRFPVETGDNLLKREIQLQIFQNNTAKPNKILQIALIHNFGEQDDFLIWVGSGQLINKIVNLFEGQFSFQFKKSVNHLFQKGEEITRNKVRMVAWVVKMHQTVRVFLRKMETGGDQFGQFVFLELQRLPLEVLFGANEPNEAEGFFFFFEKKGSVE